MPKRAPKNSKYVPFQPCHANDKLEEAVKTYQKALQWHSEKRWVEAERAYLSLLMTEIISDRVSKKVPLDPRMKVDNRLEER
jgi:hypothetical protein